MEVVMDKTSRALRRHHRARLMRRAIRKSKEWYWVDQGDQEWILWRAQRTWNNMQNCSCHMCGNERHNDWASERERLTMPERKAEDSYLDQLEEVDLFGWKWYD